MEKSFNLMLGIVITVFLIGLLIFIFALVGGGLGDATRTTTTGQITAETLLLNSENCTNTSVAGIPNIALNNVVVTNSTGGIVPSSNYAVIGGCIILL